MVRIWIKNMAGLSSTDEDMATVSHPKLELIAHVTVKNVQTFALAGLLFVGPGVAVAQGSSDWPAVRSSALRYARYGAACGMVTGPVMVGGRIMTLERQGVSDRCFRLRHNENVTRVDRMSVLGSLVGLGLASYMGEPGADGAVAGMVGGMVLAGIYNVIKTRKIMPDTSGM